MGTRSILCVCALVFLVADPVLGQVGETHALAVLLDKVGAAEQARVLDVPVADIVQRLQADVAKDTAGWTEVQTVLAQHGLVETTKNYVWTLLGLLVVGWIVFFAWPKDKSKDAAPSKGNGVDSLSTRFRAPEIVKEFREFAFTKSVWETAIALMLAGAFQPVITSMVTDILTPLVGLVLTKNGLENHFTVLRDGASGRSNYTTVEEAAADGAITLNHGKFASSCVAFLVTAVALFMLVKLKRNLAQRAVELREKVGDELKGDDDDDEQTGGDNDNHNHNRRSAKAALPKDAH